MSPITHYLVTPVIVTGLLMGGAGLWHTGIANANSINDIGSDIEVKEAEIEGIRRKIDSYEEQIVASEGQQRTLANDLSILENRIKKTQLDIQSTELTIEKTQLEVEQTRQEISETEESIKETKQMIGVVLQELYTFDDVSPLEMVFGNKVFSDFFDQIAYLETLQEDLSVNIERIQTMQQQLDNQLERQETGLARLDELREGLQGTKNLLEREQAAASVLLSKAEQSEDQYRTLLRDLREERQYVQGEIFRLQEELDRRINEGDLDPEEFVGPTVLSWPVENPRITATFHDVTYPFRHLFEHSGLDMAIPQGSVVRAAAPGVVAWTRTGRSYGNYIMIIHANGMATLYAHLSAMTVQADQFVERGEPIGRSGGMPGTPGAGLSTGPHLHFEARVDGIPNDPYDYLID